MTGLEQFFNNLTPISTSSWNKFKILFLAKGLKKGDFFIKERETAKKIGFLVCFSGKRVELAVQFGVMVDWGQ